MQKIAVALVLLQILVWFALAAEHGLVIDENPRH